MFKITAAAVARHLLLERSRGISLIPAANLSKRFSYLTHNWGLSGDHDVLVITKWFEK